MRFPHIYYARNHGPEMRDALRIVAGKGYALMLNFGCPLDSKYSALLDSAAALAMEIGSGVECIAKVNLFPPSADIMAKNGFGPECIYSAEAMRDLVGRIGPLLYPFAKKAIDLEPAKSLVSDEAYAFWKTGAADRDRMIDLEYSASADYLLPFAPQSKFYGGLYPHFFGPWICESTYPIGSKDTLPQVIPGVRVTLDDASKVLERFPGRPVFVFPAVTGKDLIQIAHELPRLPR